MMFEGEDLVQKFDADAARARQADCHDPAGSHGLAQSAVRRIADQIAEPIRVHEGTGRSAAWRRAKELLKWVRMPSPGNPSDTSAAVMSGGMRQRIVATECPVNRAC